MESEKQPILAPPGTVPSVSVALHPLVLMNVSEHWTRSCAQSGRPVPVYGALIGKQTGRAIEVMNSFELVTSTVEGVTVIDRDYYFNKSEQYKQVFPNFDMLGWYTTGGVPTQEDIKVHQQICNINESPIFVKLDPAARQSGELPVKCYESIIDVVEANAVMLLVELKYTLATEEAERIGVDHVARISNVESSTSPGGETSAATQHLNAQHSAIKMLASRVQIIMAYLQAVERGELEVNHDILRECNSLCHRLPIAKTAAFKHGFYNQRSDVELLAYLGVITQGCQAMNQFVTKFNILHDRVGHGGSRRVRGLYS